MNKSISIRVIERSGLGCRALEIGSVVSRAGKGYKMWYGFGEDYLGQKCLQRLGSEGNGENKKVEMCWVY